jgi:radical SAM protein with 4Fe4S-binding SPASM domain
LSLTKFIVDELKPANVGFNILMPQLDGKNPVDVPTRHAIRDLISAFKILRRRGIYENRVAQRVNTYANNEFHCKDCMGVGGQIVVTPAGKIGPCQALLGMDEFFPKTVDELYSKIKFINSKSLYSDVIFREWLERFPLNMKQCMRCFAISICGGGCPYASKIKSGSIWQVDKRVCSEAKQIMKWMIWETDKQLAKERPRNT